MIFNDYAALHLSRLDPKIGELLRFADSMLRPDGAAWQPQNRAMVLRRDSEVHGGRLSLEFCRRIYQWMADFQRRWDYPLLSDWRKQAI